MTQRTFGVLATHAIVISLAILVANLCGTGAQKSVKHKVEQLINITNTQIMNSSAESVRNTQRRHHRYQNLKAANLRIPKAKLLVVHPELVGQKNV